jgi:hypothetical protein
LGENFFYGIIEDIQFGRQKVGKGFLVQDKRRQLYYLGVLVGISINSVLWWTEGFGIPYYEKWENAILVVCALLYLLISVYLFKKYIKDQVPIKKQ